MTSPLPPTIEAIARRLDVAPAAVARVLEAAATQSHTARPLASDKSESLHATGATFFVSPQVQPLGPTDGRASSPASSGSTAGILEDIANDLIDDVLDDDGGFDVFNGATIQ